MTRSRVRLDLSPLRLYRDFRLLFCASLISLFGDSVTMVAAPLQMKHLTGSYVAVGLIGACEFAPLMLLGLWGGAIADAHDRRRVILLATAIEMCGTAVLFGNALAPSPQPWAIYVAATVSCTGIALRRPSQDALEAQLVPHAHQTAANALITTQYNLGAIVAPGLGGLLAAASLPAAYAVDLSTFVAALVLLVRLRTRPRSGAPEAVSLAAIKSGVRYAVGRRDLLGTYLVDIVAMFFAMSEAMYPFLADTLHAPRALGLLYSASAVGGLLMTLTSGWTGRVYRHGRAICLGSAGWGVGMVLAGVAPNLACAFAGIAVAGFADAVSGLFRATMWNQSVPDELRGRLGGIELLSFTSGPTLGGARAGLMGQLGGVRVAVAGGGALCVAGVGLLAALMPALLRYDSRTDEHTAEVRRQREKREAQEADT